MAYQHGVRVQEQATSVVAPIEGTAGLQVVFGTAPVHLATNPYGVTNTPVIAYSWTEAVQQLGFTSEKGSNGHYLYTLCESMYASFKLAGVAPVIFVNVLDPKKHKKKNDTQTVEVEDLEATVPITGILQDTVSVKNGEVELEIDTDYVLSFDDDGQTVITLTSTGAGATAETLTVESTSIDPTAVKADDIIGASASGGEKGMEVLRQIYPKFGMTPGLLLAPGWSHIPDVGLVLAAKCEEINGYFTCEGFIDLDSTASGCTAYTGCKAAKEKAGSTSIHTQTLWPAVAAGSISLWYSAVQAANTAYLDASNDDVPNLSPSNKLLGITATILADAAYDEETGTWDKEVLLDQLQANSLNGVGITTAINSNGYRNWGNNTSAYPATTDIKDRFFNCRRFFSWWGNSFILTYAQKVDDPANRRLIESIVDSENIRGAAYVSSGKCAAAYIEFTEDENPVTNLLNGKLTFHQHLSPYPPAEDILNILEFDPDALSSALTGG
jgi:hypothetical protein